VWTRIDGKERVDIGLRPLPAPHRGPLTFVVTADSHVTGWQPFFADLEGVAADATALDPPPAFFTILGDITQGSQPADFDLVDAALGPLTVPYIPVPGNHDWYDGGETWRARYGPDCYSFDIDQTHFVVWNMAMSEVDVARYLGAELKHVDPAMTIVALTHAPPTPQVIAVLDQLGVDYLMTGHTHSNRVLDHGGLVEISTEPLMMGGLDYSPAGYRVVTLDGDTLTSYHRTVIDEPYLELVAPARGQCAPLAAGELIVTAELDAGPVHVTASLDCGSELTLRYAGGWTWRGELPVLDAGAHTIDVEARTPSGARARRTYAFEACTPDPPPPAGADWPQLGGAADHTGSIARELVPPLVPQWTASAGGHLLSAAPVIANGVVYVTASDLGTGGGGGVVAFDLATGGLRWRTATPLPVRGGPAVAGETVVASQIDGTVLGLDAASGAIRWRHELGIGVEPRGAAVFAAPVADGGDVLIGNQRRLAAIDAATGGLLWSQDPVRRSEDFTSLASLAVAEGVAVGVFNREIGGVFAWERLTGRLLWHHVDSLTLSINSSPVIANGLVYFVNGATEVFARELHTGTLRWHAKLDPSGFDWAIATVGTPAIARNILVIPTLWNELVGVDATSGLVRWRFAAQSGPLRTTHYRGRDEAGFAASPVITGDIVWAVDTSGRLTAHALETGNLVWGTELSAPVLAGLATSGDWLIVAAYDGTVRGLRRTPAERRVTVPARCDRPAAADGCCQAGAADGSPLGVALGVLYAWRRRRRRRSSARAIGATAEPEPVLHA
jgi:outer membrane protein assembly factor BamB/predicted MPP superfamily phosphohydrolase